MRRLFWCNLLGVLAASLIGISCAEQQPSAEAVVSRAIERTEALHIVHFQLEVTNGTIQLGPGVEVIRAAGEVEQPDRLRVRATTNLGGFLVETEMIHYDGESYLLNPFTRRWERVGGGFTPVPLLDSERGVPSLMRSASDLRLEGPETVRDVPTWRVSGTVPAEDVTRVVGGTPGPGTVPLEAFIDEDGLVHRLVLRGPISEGDDEDTIRQLDFSQFDTAPPVVSPTLR